MISLRLKWITSYVRLKWITSYVILSLKIMFKDTIQLKRNNVLKRGFVQDVLTE